MELGPAPQSPPLPVGTLLLGLRNPTYELKHQLALANKSFQEGVVVVLREMCFFTIAGAIRRLLEEALTLTSAKSSNKLS